MGWLLALWLSLIPFGFYLGASDGADPSSKATGDQIRNDAFPPPPGDPPPAGAPPQDPPPQGD